MNALAAFLNVLGFIVFSGYSLRGVARPNATSWLLWSLNGAVLCIGHFRAGGGLETAGVPIIQTIGPAVLCVLAFRIHSKAQMPHTSIERLTGFLGLIGLCIALGCERPGMALAAGLLVEGLALIPTIEHLWMKPSEESQTAWALFFVGSVLNVCSPVRPFDLGMVVPFFFVAQTGFVFLLLTIRRVDTSLHVATTST